MIDFVLNNLCRPAGVGLNAGLQFQGLILDLDGFLALMRESGRSSFCYLQNVYTTKAPNEQGVSLALCLSDILLKDKRAAWRVHGGGFAGTIQALLPTSDADTFKTKMDTALGDDMTMILAIRAKSRN